VSDRRAAWWSRLQRSHARNEEGHDGRGGMGNRRPIFFNEETVRVAGILDVADLEKARPKESISGCTNPLVYINSFFLMKMYTSFLMLPIYSLRCERISLT
jgi:hypothetical protein